jgi:hypothetical protein
MSSRLLNGLVKFNNFDAFDPDELRKENVILVPGGTFTTTVVDVIGCRQLVISFKLSANSTHPTSGNPGTGGVPPSLYLQESNEIDFNGYPLQTQRVLTMLNYPSRNAIVILNMSLRYIKLILHSPFSPSTQLGDWHLDFHSIVCNRADSSLVFYKDPSSSYFPTHHKPVYIKTSIDSSENPLTVLWIYTTNATTLTVLCNVFQFRNEANMRSRVLYRQFYDCTTNLAVWTNPPTDAGGTLWASTTPPFPISAQGGSAVVFANSFEFSPGEFSVKMNPHDVLEIGAASLHLTPDIEFVLKSSQN